MGIRLEAITDAVQGVFASGNKLLTSTTGSLTRLVSWSAFADWVLQTYAGFTASGSGAASRPTQDKLREVVSITDFGTKTGTAADANLALAAVGENGAVFIPEGNYTWTETVNVDQRQHLFGAGEYATKITFAPTANDTAIEVKNGVAVCNQGSLRDFTLFSDDSTYTKIGIDLIDVSNWEVSGITIGGSVAVGNTGYWSGNSSTSIGLRVQGREATQIKKCQIAADRPIVIAENPNSAQIGIDHFHFADMYLLAQANPVVQVLTAVPLSNVTFSGYQVWHGGTNGFHWVDTTSVGAGINLSLKNIRWENGTDASGYMVRIEHNSNLQNLRIENLYGGLNVLGIKLRKVLNATLANVYSLNTSGTALDVNNTVQPLILDNVFFQTGSTVSVGTLRKIFESDSGDNGGTVGFRTIYALPSSIGQNVSDFPLMGSATTIAQDATAVLGVAGATAGFVFVVNDEDFGAVYHLAGASAATAEVSDPAGFFSVTKDTASSYNIYHESGNYLLQNKRTGSHVVRWFILGANI